MNSPHPPNHPHESTDIFSLSDQVLSDRLQFIEEIGFGNWGSVWLCRPKSDPQSSSADGPVKLVETKIAVKLVHRSKTSTTAARVRSLWNEMKIVRTFKSDPHPSIIPFHSFIITPSFALITMVFLPTLVPVEVDESKSKDWFRLLLSGVEFLHQRGVVHNDIKPANILLSHNNVPVLVDFGFAEKYDLKSRKAFHSNLSYGTPEYLSPERARGMPHDTRKSDVWSLGITFFEILIGRTPFEHSDGEQFTTKEDLEKYWSRTLRGKWVGSWKMSKSVEKMLRRMIAPNADLRCTTSEAMADEYWLSRKQGDKSHRRSSSHTSSILFDKDISKLVDLSPPWSRSNKGKENLPTRPGVATGKSPKEEDKHTQHTVLRAKSQPKVTASKTQVQPKKRPPVPPIINLSPIEGSPPSPPYSPVVKENVVSLNTNSTIIRKPLGGIPPGVGMRDNLPPPPLLPKPKPSLNDLVGKRKGRVLSDLTQNVENANGRKRDKGKEKEKERDRVKERVREWEREKERLREMERLDEIEKERDEEVEQERKRVERQDRADTARAKERDKENLSNIATTAAPPPSAFATSSSLELNATPNNSPLRARRGLKHSLKMSIDKTVRLYKSSTLGQVTSKNTPALSVDGIDDAESGTSQSIRQSWEDETLFREAKSSLPVVRHAVHNERVAADNRMDRMTIWMRNVEKVVEDARQNFASTSTQVAPLPPLPIAPLTRSNRSSRLPRKVLAANEIFSDETDQGQNQTMSSAYATANNTATLDEGVTCFEGPSQLLPVPQTPARQRRATVSTRSPEPMETQNTFDIDPESPSKRKEKSRSHGNLFQLHITPISKLERELEKSEVRASSPRLSEFLDRSLFIAPPVQAREDSSVPVISLPEKSFDELTASPFHVEPYPPRKTNVDAPIPDTPSQRRVEGVYDRFLMATSGVKRLGKGYQSDNTGPVGNILTPNVANYKYNHNHRAFYSTRRAMPPPVSSEDQRRTVSVDELGVMTSTPGAGSPVLKDESNTTVALVRRAIKAIVPGKTVSRRLSRLA